MNRKGFLIPLVISGLYILIGTYDYFNHGKISHFFNDLKPDLDYTVVRPSEIFGVMARFIGSYIYDSDMFFILGQLCGLIIYTCLTWILFKLAKASFRKIRGHRL